MALKTREIATILATKGYERGTKEVLEALSEELVDMRRQILLIAQLVDKNSDIMASVLQVAEKSQSIVDEVKNIQEAKHSSLGVSTQSLGSSDE